MRVAIVTAALGLAAAQQWPQPQMWPVQHTHTEIMYTVSEQTISTKKVNYDFINSHLRYDIVYDSGPQIPLVTLLNFSSYWLNNDLYMLTYATPLDDTPYCVHLNLGFGMMYPNWFLTNSSQVGTVWAAHKSDDTDPNFHKTLWTTKSDGVSSDNFDYFSFLDNNTATDGLAFRMSAPSPTGLVVNEYFGFSSASYTADDPTFVLPTTPNCTDAGFAADAYEAHALLHARGLGHYPLTEVFIASMDRHAPRPQIQGM